MKFILLLSISAFSLLFSSYCLAEQEEAALLMNCSLFVARANRGAPVIDINNQPVFLGYSDQTDLNDLQPLFILSDLAPEASFLQRRAVLARFFLTEYGQKVLEIGFYNAQIRYENSISIGVLQHPTLTSWQFEPIFVDAFYFNSDEEILINIDLNNHIGKRITGSTNYSMVNLSCSSSSPHRFEL